MKPIFKTLKRLGDGLPGLLHGLLPRAIRSVRRIRGESVPVDSVSRAEDVAAPGLRQTFGTTVLEGAVEPLSLHVAQGDRLDARGMMPFFLACSRNEVHVCRLLLDAGADPSVLTPSGVTALDIAKAAGAAEVVKMLQQLRTTHNDRQRSDGDVPAVDDRIWGDVSNTADPEPLELDGWETEPESVAPPVDLRIREAIGTYQAAINQHLAKNDSADWDDVDVSLPNKLNSPLRESMPPSMIRSIGSTPAGRGSLLREGVRPFENADTVDPSASPEGRRDPLQQLLDLAEKEGIVVEDDRRLGGSVWVRVETPRTAGERRVVRNLLRMGFESWPGKGYWR